MLRVLPVLLAAAVACGAPPVAPNVPSVVPSPVTTLTVQIGGTGAVRSIPAGIDCPGSCSATFPAGAAVQLAATPGNGALFDSWSGACSGSVPTCDLTMSAAMQARAAFIDGCAGIMPGAPGPGIDVRSQVSGYASCDDRSTSDGQGAILLGVQGGYDYGSTEWTPSSSAGAGTAFGSGPEGLPLPYPLESGFEWFVSATNFSFGSKYVSYTAGILVYAHDGTSQSTSTLYSLVSPDGSLPDNEVRWASANDPGRGLVVTHVHKDQASPHWVLLSQRFDAAGVALGGASAVAEGDGPAPDSFADGISDGGDSLTLFGDFASGAMLGRWMDAAGAPASPIFQAASVPGNATPALHRLVGGSLALEANGVWTSMFLSRASAPQAAPDWLAGRPGAQFTIVRGATAYALFSHASGCAPVHVELLSRSGSQCGSLDLPMTAGCARAGTSGLDGTVILTGSDSYDTVCVHSYWPQLLR